MTRNLLSSLTLAAILTFFIVPLYGQQNVAHDSAAAISQKQLKKEIGEAHTHEQYRMLAAYFHSRENFYHAQATEEKIEWERRKQVQASVVMKYPTPADSARNLYDYYNYKAAEMAKKAAKYENSPAS